MLPALVYGAGLGIGASSLMLITLSGAGTSDAGLLIGLALLAVWRCWPASYSAAACLSRPPKLHQIS